MEVSSISLKIKKNILNKKASDREITIYGTASNRKHSYKIYVKVVLYLSSILTVHRVMDTQLMKGARKTPAIGMMRIPINMLPLIMERRAFFLRKAVLSLGLRPCLSRV